MPGHELEGKPPGSFNLHDFRWDHALYSGRQIFKDEFPTDVTVYLIEAKSLELGLELSDIAQKSAVIVADKITKRIDAYNAK